MATDVNLCDLTIFCERMIKPSDNPHPLVMPANAFVQWFRAAAPYIHAFGGKTFVLAFGGEVLTEGQFISLAHDINLLNSLGVKLVLVHGARPQIEAGLAARKAQIHYVDGLRVTDDAALACVKEAVGSVRVEIEALLSMGLASSPMAGADIRVASGNFVTARPAGVRNGVDLIHTGEVRKIDANAIRSRLDHEEIVLLSPIGYSPTGEVFNVALEDVALHCAIALDAEKLIFLMDTPGVLDEYGNLLKELTPEAADKVLANSTGLPEDVGLYLPAGLRASRSGVARTHFISRHIDGGVLQELFTHDGIGSMLSEQQLETLCRASIEDVGGILGLIEPLEQEGVLVRRKRELLEMEIDRFHVLVHDGVIVGCSALYPFLDEQMAELACLAVAPEFRNSGRGDVLLGGMENQARDAGCNKLFVLTTQAAHWFVERGFIEAELDALPKRKQDLYNYQRRSKVLVKQLR